MPGVQVAEGRNMLEVFVARIALGAFGAALQELLYWYVLKTRLQSQRYQALLRSRQYWLITCLMILASGIATSIYFEPSYSPRLWDMVIFGAAFPVLLKQFIKAARAKTITLGDTLDSRKVTDYLFGG